MSSVSVSIIHGRHLTAPPYLRTWPAGKVVEGGIPRYLHRAKVYPDQAIGISGLTCTIQKLTDLEGIA